MPKTLSKHLSTLQSITLAFVVKHFQEVIHSTTRKATASSLGAMSGVILEELICHLKQSKECNDFLSVLTGKQITHINLENSISLNNSTLLWMTGNCPNITKLSLAKCQSVDCQTLKTAMQYVPLVTDLDLSYTNIDDDVMETMSYSCRNLQKLSIAHTSVSDIGVLSICGDINQVNARCDKMEWLDVNETLVGEESLTVALVKLKNLLYLNHPSLADLITNIHGNCLDGQMVPLEDCYKLQVVEFKRHGHDNQWLQKCVKTVCTYCPNLTDVSICDADEDCMTPLVKLKQLQCLMLHTWQDNCAHLNMGGGLSYLLWGRGYNLLQLHLEGVEDIDLCAIGQFCSNLEVLAITVPDISPFPSYPCNGPCQKKPNLFFNKLKSLSLSCWSNQFTYPFTNHALLILLEGAVHLETIKLCNISGMEDNVLTEALETNPLKYLQEIRLRGCDDISGDSVIQVLLAENNLQIIEISNCQLIGYCHVDEMNAVIKENKFSTEIKFIPYQNPQE